MPKTTSLYRVPVEEKSYQVDLSITDQYQAFSTELVRLSLLGIAGYGFLLSNVAFHEGKPTSFLTRLSSYPLLPLCALGLVAFAVATASALAHRYYSSDAITHLATLYRLYQLRESEYAALDERVSAEEKGLHLDLSRCERLLKLSAIALLVGASAVAALFWSVLAG